MSPKSWHLVGWQDELTLGLGGDVEFGTQVHYSSLQDGTSGTAVQEEETWAHGWSQTQQEMLWKQKQPEVTLPAVLQPPHGSSGGVLAQCPQGGWWKWTGPQHMHKCLLKIHMQSDLCEYMATHRDVSNDVPLGSVVYHGLRLKHI